MCVCACVCVCVCVRARARHREADRDRDRQTDTETESTAHVHECVDSNPAKKLVERKSMYRAVYVTQKSMDNEPRTPRRDGAVQRACEADLANKVV